MTETVTLDTLGCAILTELVLYLPSPKDITNLVGTNRAIRDSVLNGGAMPLIKQHYDFYAHYDEANCNLLYQVFNKYDKSDITHITPTTTIIEQNKKVCIMDPDTDWTDLANIRYISDMSNVEVVVLPYATTVIEKYAFQHLYKLTTVVIPNSVRVIKQRAFCGCESLNNISIPNLVTRINANTFSNCRMLTDIIIPGSVKSIGANAFDECSALKTVNILGLIPAINEYAFFNCRSLTSITIPESVKTIGKYAFYGCSALDEIIIPRSVTCKLARLPSTCVIRRV